MDFKYKIKGEELYIFLELNIEASDDFLSNAKRKLSKLSTEVNTFARKIGFEGKVAKVIIHGVLIATIAISVDVSSTDIDSSNIDEVVTDRLSKYKDFEQELDINKYFLPKNSKKYGTIMKPKYIVIHNTANSASAYGEVSYLHSNVNNNYISFHFAVDENEIWQALPENINGWHAGDGDSEDSYNRNSIGVEIARSTIHDPSLRDEAIENAARLVAYLMVKNDIPLENVITHHDASGKYCPHDIFDRYGWENFTMLVSSYL